MPRKALDCVAMKLAIQRRLAAERRREGDEAFRRATHEWLSVSSDPLATWWRRVTALSPHGGRPVTGQTAQEVAEADSRYAATPTPVGQRRRRALLRNEEPTR